jgi:hypothetical protein
MLNKESLKIEFEIAAVLSQLSSMANDRKGGAWKTSSCVVGNDMAAAVFESEVIIRRFRFYGTSVDAQTCVNISTTIKTAARDFTGCDAEGFVVGTMLELAFKIEALADTIA